jgi:hypothetical protein
MSFLGSLHRIWNDYILRRQREAIIDEPITRFLTSRKNHFSSKNNVVKPGAFLPYPRTETSVFRTIDLPEERIWNLWKNYVDRGQKPLCGRADLQTRTVIDVKLRLVPDDVPPRHANIVGWPPEKDEQKAFAIALAEHSSLVLLP